MRANAIRFVIALTATAASGTGWIGQRRVNAPNDSVADGQPCVAVDSDGNPWVLWLATFRSADTSLFYARWQGDAWEPERGVGPNAVGARSRLRPSLAFDQSNVAWAAWHNGYSDLVRNIGSSHWTDTGWTLEQQVNQPDSTDHDYAPKVACGGGQVWCVWYGGPTSSSSYSVFASRWNDGTGRWEDETQVSPPDGNHHWWCDVAVDTLGTPHVVWCTYPLYTVFYSYFDGQQWVAPIPVNDTTQVMVSSWASPRIVIDRVGTMHVCFTGAKVGAMHSDIFYSRNDGAGWSQCQMVTRDSIYDEWYSDIAADGPGNVWVVWDREGEGSDPFRVYAAHSDDTLWLPEERLDNDSTWYDNAPEVCLDSLGQPWVVWTGITNGATDDVYYNRYETPGSLQREPGGLRGGATRIVATSPAVISVRFSFSVAQAGRVRLEVRDMSGRYRGRVVDEVLPAGQHTVTWNARLADGRRIPAGIYIGCLEAAGFRKECKFVMLFR